MITNKKIQFNNYFHKNSLKFKHAEVFQNS